MTERPAIDALERRFGDRIRAYADTGTTKSVDSLDVARVAMAAQGRASSTARRFVAGFLERRLAVVGAAVLVGAVVIWGLVGGVRPRETVGQSLSPGSASGVLPDTLRHPWQRPVPIAPPASDPFKSGYLRFAGGTVETGSAYGQVESTSRVTFVGVDSVVLAATGQTSGCAPGSVGNYGRALQGRETAMALTPIGTDACPAREAQLAGFWVRADLAGPGGGEVMLPAGTHTSVSFDLFGEPGRADQLSYTVPAGWAIFDDGAAFMLHRPPDLASASPVPEASIFLISQPWMAGPFADNVECDVVTDAPGVGTEVDDIVAAIGVRHDVTSSAPTAIVVGGYAGQMLDLRLAVSSAGTCHGPSGPAAAAPIIHQGRPRPEPMILVTPDHPVRLILVDLGKGRTLAIGVSSPGPIAPSSFDQVVGQAMPIVESVAFHPPSS
jgi:hypothetical protein